MVKLEAKVRVPASLADIKLKDYQRFMVVVKNQGEDMDDLFLRQKMVEIFCGVPLTMVMKMRRKDFVALSNVLIMIIQEKPELTPTVQHKGREFGFIPDIDNDLLFEEYVDLDSYMKDWSDFHKAIAILYRPVTLKKKKKYLIEPYEGSAKYSGQMLEMPMNIVMGAVLFFYHLSNDLLTITPKYLNEELRKNPEIQTFFQKSGVGINTLTNSLQETCLRLEKLLNYRWGPLYSGLPTTKTSTQK